MVHKGAQGSGQSVLVLESLVHLVLEVTEEITGGKGEEKGTTLCHVFVRGRKSSVVLSPLFASC